MDRGAWQTIVYTVHRVAKSYFSKLLFSLLGGTMVIFLQNLNLLVLILKYLPIKLSNYIDI